MSSNCFCAAVLTLITSLACVVGVIEAVEGLPKLKIGVAGCCVGADVLGAA
jgi:hypothetical protein